MWYIQAIEQQMSDQDKRLLSKIYAPVTVAVPPEDARRGLCVTPDGELRHYGERDKTSPFLPGRPCYLSSRDGGLSWKYHEANEGCLGSAAYFPTLGRYLSLSSAEAGEQKGTYVNLSSIGPDDEEFTRIKISDLYYFDMFLPQLICGGKRVAASAQIVLNGEHHPAFFRSDDGGFTWHVVHLPSAPPYTPVYPSVAPRWENHSSESVFRELKDGSLCLIARTSHDRFYEYISTDGGESWSEGKPSHFHGTLTTPYFLELSDGRTLFFWNNTQPLPEVCHANELPPHDAGFVFQGEDVFTNRDACHAAISSDDGHCWTGFRELLLNEVRNAPDFRSRGGILSSADRSVQQFQAMELPFGKVLVSVGQNAACRKMLIFDPEWLCETTRSEDFKSGFGDISTHLYVKSLSGCFVGRGHPGHCQWNRTAGALLVPDPIMDGTEVLQICRIHDPRLFSEKQGMVWNFPCTRKGRIDITLRREGEGISVCLCDCWFNPCDDTVSEASPFSFRLTRDTVPEGVWHEISILFDADAAFAEVLLNGTLLFGVRMKLSPEHGISYLHLQTAAENMDEKGTLIKQLRMQAL